MAEKASIRILLADDQALVRRGVRLILDGEPDLEVVAEAGDGAEAIALARTHAVDLAVLDVAMPRMTGLQAARELSALQPQPQPRILMLTMYDNEQYFFEALKAGACGYVLKSGRPRSGRRVPGGHARRAVPLPRSGHRPHPQLPRPRAPRRGGPGPCADRP
jgi:DNA-binding NarL/FixJ family response regulator